MKPSLTTLAVKKERSQIKYIKKFITLLVVAVLVISTSSCSKSKQQDLLAGDQQKAVHVVKIAEEKQPVSLNYIGTVDAEELVKYSFKTSGQIEKIYAANGDQISKGEKLAKLDTTDLEFQVSAARAVMDTAEVNVTKAEDALNYANSLFEKTAALYDNGGVSKNSFEQMQLNKDMAASDYLQAKSQYAAAKTDYDYKSDLLDNSIIYSEQDGFVAQKVFNENERVSAYTPVLIVRSGAQIVNIGIPQQELTQIAIGSMAVVNVDDETAEGIVTNISEIPDVTTRTYTAEISISEKTFRLGSIAKVSIDIGDQNGIWIPMSSVFSDGENYVYLIKDQRAFKRTVEIQNISDERVQVTGLDEGESLAVSGMKNLDDGTQVKVQDQETENVQDN